MNEIIKRKLKELPNKPGVYIMKDSLSNIIYVGKAKILKNRVRQYFRKNSSHTDKVKKMVENIYDLNWIVTDSEVEALILECNLIKRHMPKYNILLKDDKTYPFIKVTLSEDYPRILVVRKVDNKKDRFFGPYTNSHAVKMTVDYLRKTYGIRDCNRDLSKACSGRECLNYHIHQCSSPCMRYISKEDYRKNVMEAVEFLEGKGEKLLNKLNEEMTKLSKELKFEAAAELRDRISHLNALLEKQKISVPKDTDCDLLGIASDLKYTCVTVMFIRGGKLLGSKNSYFGKEEDKELILTDFIKQFYVDKERIPKEIYLSDELSEEELLSELLTVRKESGVVVSTPKKGRKKELCCLAYKNALEGLKQKTSSKYEDAVSGLSQLLNLERSPERIEVFDISNTAGSDIVAFMTVFNGGVPKKSEYRKFKMKYTETQDDYMCMKEVIYRRLTHYLDDKRLLEQGEDISKLKFINFPDLIFVDGGKGQVKAAKEAARMAELNVNIFGLVKDDKHRTRDITDEYREYKAYENRPVFNMISKMQDETHNQAVLYHHSLRTRNLIKSELLAIDKVGEKTRNKLFMHFKTIDNIKNASVEELSKVIGNSLAVRVYEHFKNE